MPGGKLSADYLILKRRQAEDHKVFYESVCKSNFKAGAYAEWEIRSAQTIEHNKMLGRFNQIRKADAAALDARRHRLAEMLRREEAQAEADIAALTETPEERKVRMETRAKELGDKREASGTPSASSSLSSSTPTISPEPETEKRSNKVSKVSASVAWQCQ